MKVAVTGARGFIGRRLTAHLTGRGHAVIPINRDDWDLTSGTSPAPLLAGCDAVVHLAGRVHVRGRASDEQFARTMFATNVLGTVALANGAAEAGVRRFVFVSSSTVYGKVADGVAIDEGTPLNPETAYGRSKVAAEDALRELAGRGGPDVVCLRPPPVYGPGMAGNFLSLLRYAKRGLPMPSGALIARRSFVSLSNLCALIVCALEIDRPARDAYVAGEPARAIGEVYAALCAAAGGKPLVVPMPRATLRLALALAGRAALAGALFDDFMMNAVAARQELGWAPQDMLADELGRAMAEADRL